MGAPIVWSPATSSRSSRVRSPWCLSGQPWASSQRPTSKRRRLSGVLDRHLVHLCSSLRGGESAITAAACICSKSPSQITSVILRTLERIPVNLIYTRKSHYSFRCQTERQASGSQREFQRHSAPLRRFSLRLRLS